MSDAKKIDTPATRKVAEALAAHGGGMSDRLRPLAETARSAEEAAASLGVEVAAIVKTLIFDFIPDDGADGAADDGADGAADDGADGAADDGADGAADGGADGAAEPIPLAVLISGDRRCRTAALAGALGLTGRITRPDADRVKAVTGYSIGGVSPAGLPGGMTVLIDSRLARSEMLWAAAGHTHLVFGCTMDELTALTRGRICDGISE